MSHSEGTQLIRLHEAFRFISYLLLLLSFYLTCMDFFIAHNLYLEELGFVVEKLLRLHFLSGLVPSKLLTLVVLLITCLGTKAQKQPELKVTLIVLQILSGLVFYWASLWFLPRQPLAYMISSLVAFVMVNVGFDNVSKLISVNLMKDRFNTIVIKLRIFTNSYIDNDTCVFYRLSAHNFAHLLSVLSSS